MRFGCQDRFEQDCLIFLKCGFHKELINYCIAETFEGENFPEFWKSANLRKYSPLKFFRTIHHFVHLGTFVVLICSWTCTQSSVHIIYNYMNKNSYMNKAWFRPVNSLVGTLVLHKTTQTSVNSFDVFSGPTRLPIVVHAGIHVMLPPDSLLLGFINRLLRSRQQL